MGKRCVCVCVCVGIIYLRVDILLVLKNIARVTKHIKNIHGFIFFARPLLYHHRLFDQAHDKKKKLN